MLPVSHAYLLGIHEGRAELKALLADGIPRDEALRAALRTSQTLLAQGFSGEMHEALRGQRDFYRNQVKIFHI